MKLLDLLVSADPQELFDRAIEKLAAQGAPSRDEKGYAILDREGRRSAAGHLVRPEIKIDPAVRTLSGLLEKVSFNERRHLLFLLADLEYAHDTANSRFHLRTLLHDVAVENGLTPASVWQHMTTNWGEAGSWG